MDHERDDASAERDLEVVSVAAGAVGGGVGVPSVQMYPKKRLEQSSVQYVIVNAFL